MPSSVVANAAGKVNKGKRVNKKLNGRLFALIHDKHSPGDSSFNGLGRTEDHEGLGGACRDLGQRESSIVPVAFQTSA